MALLREQFERYVTPEPNSGCWLWAGPMWRKSGYGILCGEGHKMAAHRYAYETFVGAIGGLDVCHRCDTPLCVNPAHLFTGTAADNARDAARKGRVKHPNQKGEANSGAKLSAQSVASIRERLQRGERQKDIAEIYGVHPSLISHIRRGAKW